MQVNTHSAHKRSERKRLVFKTLLLLLLVGVTVVWILNIVGIIGGPWSAILAALFTVSGVGITLFNSQEHSQGEA